MKYLSLLITQVSESDYTHINKVSTKINAFDMLTDGVGKFEYIFDGFVWAVGHRQINELSIPFRTKLGCTHF